MTGRGPAVGDAVGRVSVSVIRRDNYVGLRLRLIRPTDCPVYLQEPASAGEPDADSRSKLCFYAVNLRFVSGIAFNAR